MANSKISDLTGVVTPAGTDEFAVNQAGTSKKMTLTQIDTFISSGFATTALDNLASVAINTSLISDTDNTDDLGSSAIGWQSLYLSDANTSSPTTNGEVRYNNSTTQFEFYENGAVQTLGQDPGGADTQVQFNDGGSSFGGDAGLTFNKTTNVLTVGGGTVINEDGADSDTRIEGDTDENLFYVDAGNDRIGINTDEPNSLIDVREGNIEVTDINSVAATEGLDDYNDFSQATWSLTSDFDIDGTNATFNYSTGSGSIIQDNADIDAPLWGETYFKLQYVISASPTVVGATMSIPTGLFESVASLPITAGTTTIILKTVSSTVGQDFRINVSGATSGSFTIESISLRQIIGGDVKVAGKLIVSGRNGSDEEPLISFLGETTSQDTGVVFTVGSELKWRVNNITSCQMTTTGLQANKLRALTQTLQLQAVTNVSGDTLVEIGNNGTKTDGYILDLYNDNFSNKKLFVDVAGSLGILDGITAPDTVSGFAQLYVDSADGDLKIKFGDGTVKTIATDT